MSDKLPTMPWEILGQRLESAEARVAELTARVGELEAALEQDRSTVADGVTAIRKAIGQREWLRLGRGSYEWDDDRWKDEFGQAIDEIFAAMKPLQYVASNWALCPREQHRVQEARQALDGSPAPERNIQEERMDAYQFGTVPAPVGEDKRVPERQRVEQIRRLALTAGQYPDNARHAISDLLEVIDEIVPSSRTEQAVVEAAMDAADKLAPDNCYEVLWEACGDLAKAREAGGENV